MKKKILIIIAAFALAASAAGCGQVKDTTENTQTAQTEKNGQTKTDVSGNYADGASKNVDMDKVDGVDLDSESDKADSSATLEESAVSIEDAKVVDYEGKRLVIVSYKFTNKSNSDQSFTALMKSEAYQDGLSISNAIGDFNIEGFEPASTAEIIAPGKTITVQEAFLLVNDAPVEVVVQEFHSQSGVNVTKTFNLQ